MKNKSLTFKIGLIAATIFIIVMMSIIMVPILHDSNLTEDYTDGMFIHHDGILMTPVYDEFGPVLHTLTFQYDHHDTPWTTDIYRTYDNGVYVGYTDMEKGYAPSPKSYFGYPLYH